MSVSLISTGLTSSVVTSGSYTLHKLSFFVHVRGSTFHSSITNAGGLASNITRILKVSALSTMSYSILKMTSTIELAKDMSAELIVSSLEIESKLRAVATFSTARLVLIV